MRLRVAILLNGAVGVGKTTLGRALAAQMDAGFIDGDDHGDKAQPACLMHYAMQQNYFPKAITMEPVLQRLNDNWSDKYYFNNHERIIFHNATMSMST